jgi:hypothetical protein
MFHCRPQPLTYFIEVESPSTVLTMLPSLPLSLFDMVPR